MHVIRCKLNAKPPVFLIEFLEVTVSLVGLVGQYSEYFAASLWVNQEI